MTSYDVIDRINLIIETEQISRDALSQKTGIGYTRWTNTLQRKTKLRHEEIEAIGNAWPEYMLWLAYGIEKPEMGQISPMTKKSLGD
ncbi:XRE family transcriptional regulator [Cellvibrio sp. UBA7671]|uniref:XRE family transcriptional regulator n=1 Tax=Cellvibrio sp. UBA7671 TaxID=1946312 RepID=UPI002F355572